jgi:L-lactate dehydrogenase complex protein LldG
MTARESILQAVRAARPAATPLPDVRAAAGGFPPAAGDVVARFREVARATGVTVLEGARREAADLVARAYPDASRIVSVSTHLAGTVPVESASRELADIDLFVCEAVLGVAENGAVWLPASRLGRRAAAFLAPDVVVLLDRAAVVADLHQAYERLDLAAESFGVFVAGPSKTADIEQSLVIGAHGPKSLTLILFGAVGS